MWRALEMMDYLSEHPAPFELIAAFMGVKPKRQAVAADASDPSGIGGLVQRFPSGLVPSDR